MVWEFLRLKNAMQFLQSFFKILAALQEQHGFVFLFIGNASFITVKETF